MSWLRIGDERESVSGKTKSWTVRTMDGTKLGEVQWYSRWRKYAFIPHGLIVLEEDCMRDLAEFVEDRTREHRRSRAADKAVP